MASSSRNPQINVSASVLQLPPSFFRIYFPDNMEERTKIPTGFLEHFDDDVPKRVTLRNRFAYEWGVKVEKVEGHYYFTEGWKNFRVQNSVTRLGELLLFVKESWNSFYVEVFGRSTCLRQNVYLDERRRNPGKLKNTDFVVNTKSQEVGVPILKFKIDIAQTQFFKKYLPIPKVWWDSVAPTLITVPDKVFLQMEGKFWFVSLTTDNGRIKLEGEHILHFLTVNSIVVGQQLMLEIDREAEDLAFDVTLDG